MNIPSTPFICNDYWPEYNAEYNDIDQLNQRIDETQSELALVNANLTSDIENVFNSLNIYVKDQADTSISNNIIVNNLNANYAEGRFANFDNTFTNNAYIENLTVNKPVFDITLNTPHLENTTSLNGNFYSPNIIGARLSGDISGDLNVINVNQLNAVNAIIANLFVNTSASPINSCAVLGYDREGKVIPAYATYNVNFPEDADYVWTDFAGTSRKGIKATEIGEVDNLITAYAVKNSLDIVNNSFNDVNNSFNDVSNSFNDVNNSFNDVNNSFNDVNNKIETEISKLAENFNTNNLSAENTATNNLDVSNITVNKTTGTEGQVIGKEDGNVKWVNVIDVSAKAIIDTVWPIGVIYTQYPQQKSPQELFPNTTWEEVNYSGAFFRASGGNAAAFNGDKQGQSIQSHNHGFSWSGSHSHRITDPGHRHTVELGVGDGGAGHGGERTERHYSWDTTSFEKTGISIDSAEISISGTTGSAGGNETRPENYTIRIWKRTA